MMNLKEVFCAENGGISSFLKARYHIDWNMLYNWSIYFTVSVKIEHSILDMLIVEPIDVFLEIATKYIIDTIAGIIPLKERSTRLGWMLYFNNYVVFCYFTTQYALQCMCLLFIRLCPFLGWFYLVLSLFQVSLIVKCDARMPGHSVAFIWLQNIWS